MKVFLNGTQGRLNKTLQEVAPDVDAIICTGGTNPRENPNPGIAESDVIIDFSYAKATRSLLEHAAKHNKPIVIATTGHPLDERAALIEDFSPRIPIVWSGNYALGVNVFFYLVRQAAKLLGPEFHPELVELHHARKKDSPGGTAERIADIICKERQWDRHASSSYGRHGLIGARPDEEIGIHALRCGEVTGEHIVYFAGPHERIEIVQRSQSKRSFALGAFHAARWVLDKKPGHYIMEDILGLNTMDAPKLEAL
ncbi:MAG TPA: 4-hydroxy-tetrahydrodipicolinate reductase [Opitutae bacterium]|nr:4-hydroxy-tetrahydrodipicolinate reductase [Opitutae bacterium]